jgi:hypothetical protein
MLHGEGRAQIPFCATRPRYDSAREARVSTERENSDPGHQVRVLRITRARSGRINRVHPESHDDRRRKSIEREIKMNTVKIAVTLSMLLASPALARPIGHALLHPTDQAAATSDVVTVGGQYIGRDPDANVRAELRRDAGSYLGED